MKKVVRLAAMLLVMVMLVGVIPAQAINFNEEKFSQEEKVYMSITFSNIKTMLEIFNNLNQLFPACPLDPKRYREWYYVMNMQFEAIRITANEYIDYAKNVPTYYKQIDKDYREALDNIIIAVNYFDDGYGRMNPDIVREGMPYWEKGCNQFSQTVAKFLELVEKKNGEKLRID